MSEGAQNFELIPNVDLEEPTDAPAAEPTRPSPTAPPALQRAPPPSSSTTAATADHHTLEEGTPDTNHLSDSPFDSSSVSSGNSPFPDHYIGDNFEYFFDTPGQVLSEKGVATSTPTHGVPSTPIQGLHLGSPVTSRVRSTQAGTYGTPAPFDSDSDDLYAIGSNLPPWHPACTSSQQAAFTYTQSEPTALQVDSKQPATEEEIATATPASDPSKATSAECLTGSAPDVDTPRHLASGSPTVDPTLSTPNPPRSCSIVLPPGVQQLIYSGQHKDEVHSIAVSGPDPLLKAQIEEAFKRWKKTTAPLCYKEVAAALPDRSLHYNNWEDPLHFENRIRTELNEFLKKDKPAHDTTLICVDSSGDQYFQEAEYKQVRELASSDSSDLGFKPTSSNPPPGLIRRHSTEATHKAPVGSHYGLGESLDTATRGLIRATTPILAAPPKLVFRRERNSPKMTSKNNQHKGAPRGGHPRELARGAAASVRPQTADAVLAVHESMTEMLQAQRSDFGELMQRLDDDIATKLGLIRQDIHTLVDTRMDDKKCSLLSERELIRRQEQSEEACRNQSSALAKTLADTINTLKEEIFTELNRRCTQSSHSSGHSHHHFGADGMDPSPIHHQRGGPHTAPQHPVGAYPHDIYQNSSTPNNQVDPLSETPHRPSAVLHHPTFVLPPRYDHLPSRAVRLDESATGGHSHEQLAAQHMEPSGNLGQVKDSVYMASPNRPTTETSGYHGNQDHQAAFGHHTPYQQASYRSNDPNASSVPFRYSSAQLNSFVKPVAFGKQTAHRSAEKFISEYKFYIEPLYPDNPGMQSKCLYGHLKDRAASWYYANVMDKPLMGNRDAMYKAFLASFGGENPETVVNGYRNRKQKPEETLEDYMTDMISLLANSQMDEKTQVDYLINGLREELANSVRVKLPKSITDVEKLALEVDITIQAIKKGLAPAAAAESPQLCELQTRQSGNNNNKNNNNNSNNAPPQRSNSYGGSRDGRFDPSKSNYNQNYERRFQGNFNQQQNGRSASGSRNGHPNNYNNYNNNGYYNTNYNNNNNGQYNNNPDRQGRSNSNNNGRSSTPYNFVSTWDNSSGNNGNNGYYYNNNNNNQDRGRNPNRSYSNGNNGNFRNDRSASNGNRAPSGNRDNNGWDQNNRGRPQQRNNNNGSSGSQNNQGSGYNSSGGRDQSHNRRDNRSRSNDRGNNNNNNGSVSFSNRSDSSHSNRSKSPHQSQQ